MSGEAASYYNAGGGVNNQGYQLKQPGEYQQPQGPPPGYQGGPPQQSGPYQQQSYQEGLGPYPPPNGYGYGPSQPMPAGGEKYSFDETFKIKPKWNDLWAGILVRTIRLFSTCFRSRLGCI